MDFSEMIEVPRNIDAEMSVLGACILDSKAIDIVLSCLDENDFYHGPHRRLLSCMRTMVSKREHIDGLTLVEELKSHNVLTAIGGHAYIAELMNCVPDASNVRHHAKLVKDKSIARRAITGAGSIIESAGTGDMSLLFRRIEGLYNTCRPAVVDTPAQELTELYKHEEDTCSWVVNDLIPENQVTLIAGARGSMKTYLAWGLAVCISMGEPFADRFETQQRNVIVIDYENPSAVISDRKNKIGCPEGFYIWTKNKDPKPPKIDEPGGFDKFKKLIERYGPNPVLIFDTLSKSHSSDDENDNVKMTKVIKHYTELSESGATVILLHHTSITVDAPVKSRGASAIEGDVDNVFLLHQKEKGKVRISCPKHRMVMVPNLEFRLTGNREYMYFVDISEQEA